MAGFLKHIANVVQVVEFCKVELKRKQALLRSNLPGFLPYWYLLWRFLKLALLSIFLL